MHFSQVLRFHLFSLLEAGSFSDDWFLVAPMWDEGKEMQKVWWLAGPHEVPDLNLVIGATILDCFQDQTSGFYIQSES